MLERVKAKVRSLLGVSDNADKAEHEFAYWSQRARIEGKLGSAFYERLYTEMFGLTRDFYRGKRVLDIGCGPRGSLEWAIEATERVGLDPLIDRYKQLGIDRHAMQYVAAPAEHIPFPDAYFDVVTSLNSLDHVDDPDAAIREIARVVRPGGAFLLEVEVGHSPTPKEPISLWFDVLDVLAPYFDVISDHRYEMPAGVHAVHGAYLKGGPFELSKGRHRGVLIAHLHRKG